MSLEVQVISNGCKECLSEWFSQRGNLCSSAQGFIDPHFLDHVFYLKKALYGLKQAPKAWYDHFTEYLVSNGFTRGQADRTLFIKKVDGELVVA